MPKYSYGSMEKASNLESVEEETIHSEDEALIAQPRRDSGGNANDHIRIESGINAVAQELNEIQLALCHDAAWSRRVRHYLETEYSHHPEWPLFQHHIREYKKKIIIRYVILPVTMILVFIITILVYLRVVHII